MMGSMDKSAQRERSFVGPGLDRMARLADWPAAVPVVAQVNEFIPELCRLPYDYLYRDDAAAMAECTLLAWEYTGVDMLTASLDIYDFEAESAGAKIGYYAGHMPDVDRSDFLVKGADDLDKVRFGGLSSGRLPYLVEHYEAWARLSGLDAFPSFCAPWSLACSLYGLEGLLVACLADPEFAHELLRRCVDDLLGPMVAALGDVLPLPSAISCADAWFSPPMVSMDIMEEYEPYVPGVAAAAGLDVPVSSSGIWGYSHLKGADLLRLAGLVTRVGGGVSAFDPDVQNIGPEFFRGYADKHGAALRLGYSTLSLALDDRDAVVERVKNYVLVGKDGPTPLTLFLNNIAPQTPVENIVAAVEAVRTYGAVGATAETPFLHREPEPFEDFLRRKIADNPVGYSFGWLERSGYAHLS
jgi:hypothetical protein